MKFAQLSMFALSLFVLGACAPKEQAAEPVRAVRTMVLAPTTVGGKQEFAAEIRARTESRLGFRVGGKMSRRFVEPGERVRSGQLLAQLDPQDLRLAQDAASAAVRAAEANAVQAKAELRRFKELRDQGFVSAAEIERRESVANAAQAVWDQARAQAAAQVNQLDYGRLVADAPGVVVAVEAEPGAVLSPGAPVLRIALDGPRDAVFSVPEDRVRALRALSGRKGTLQVRLWGDGTAPIAATLREISPAADPATRTFLVKADLLAADVRLGQTATVTIDRPSVPDVLKVPLSAVLESAGKAAVWILDAATMTVRLQPIEVAGADGVEVVVAGGLQPGQVIVTAGVHALTPGQKVTQYAVARTLAAAVAASSAAASASAR